MMDHTNLTIAAYNKNSKAYEAKFMYFEPYQQQVSHFIELMPSAVCVLDLGCGPGNTARQLIASGKIRSLVGIDLCAEMISSARQNAPRGEFLVQDVREASYPSRSFDVVVMSFCIVHLTDQEAESLLCRAERWLRPGGLLYLSFMEGKKSGWEATSFSNQELYFNYFDGNLMASLLQQHGLTIKRVQRQGYPETDGSVTTDVFIFAAKE